MSTSNKKPRAGPKDSDEVRSKREKSHKKSIKKPKTFWETVTEYVYGKSP